MGLYAVQSKTASVIRQAESHALDPSLLYESVIELAHEGLITAVCLNSAADILLTQLGLPDYFFRTITKDSLKRVLRTVAANIEVQDGQLVLRGEVSEARLTMDGGVQARIATAENRDRMEAALNKVMSGYRVEYYFSRESGYYTYIIHPEQSPCLADVAPGESPFAFKDDPDTPQATRERYEDFLHRHQDSVVPVVDVSVAEETGEARLMFLDDFTKSVLPVIRRMTEDLGITLNRAYWETYRGQTDRLESVCSIYLQAESGSPEVAQVVRQLRNIAALDAGDLDDLYTTGALTFAEYIFGTLASAFAHLFIHKQQDTDKHIMAGLSRQDLRDALANRVYQSNCAEYTREWVFGTVRRAPELVKWLYRLFDSKFNPAAEFRLTDEQMAAELHDLKQRAAITFVDDTTRYDIMHYMTRIVTDVYRTNFYQEHKRSFALRLDPAVLDPLVFSRTVYGVYFVAGFYSQGTHMRAADVARGGLRLIRVTPGNYEDELDNMPVLNFALGPVAQRLKHKDIAESGAKGVIVPRPEFARDGLRAVFDYTEGIMDLMQPSAEVVDYLGKPEMIFFGPDEGTAGFMDAIAERARQRGYRYWRTITTGKTSGLPHDTYGLTNDNQVFGLISHGAQGTELQFDCLPVVTTSDTSDIAARLHGVINASGMTTMGVMNCLRTVLAHAGMVEEETNLMMTGGPDGDLGANQIQSYRGRICLIVDGGSILFDPEGLDREELLRLAVARHTRPRLDSSAYPTEKLSPRGFQVLRAPGECSLPDGTKIPDGAFFHRGFLENPDMAKYMAEANIEAFVPCGGARNTINGSNVRPFLGNFQQLRVIVEGANVFFDDTARGVVAQETSILQIRDSSANKGGVTSSSIAEVLTAFLLGDQYEEMLDDPGRRSDLIRGMFALIAANAAAEAKVLLQLREQTGDPLFRLSVRTSEQLLSLQDQLHANLDAILADQELVRAAIGAYVPSVLLDWLGLDRVLEVLETPDLVPYRDAIVTKKLAALALYSHAPEWDDYLKQLEGNLLGALRRTAGLG